MYEEIDESKQKQNRESKLVATQHPMYEDIEEIDGNKQKQKKESKPIATQQQETTTTQQEVSPHCT